ncbi:hypothetical protein DRW41_16965 [Neobacillus piezotolerans]|uniref:Uncharacterized protein n=1 Tax=Neobacillus piezotolerans TaxID=2259171 RepID=A0A3D8GNG8_9BACI|nr:hypothetical protein [Neobacillus piezotolerans]RDU35822.1 hypothetical protein DRW41_16965 [Neobacillus piezotolerans]
MGKQNNFHLMCLGLLIIAAAYLDSPFSFLNNDYYYETETPQPAPAVTRPVSRNFPEYEMILVDERKNNGYIIETYKEYEVIKDKEGKIIERKPGTRTEEIRYRDYTFRQAE